jgi:hypothetical protein
MVRGIVFAHPNVSASNFRRMADCVSRSARS